MSKSDIASLDKTELSVKLNDLLGTQGIGFEKMNKEDLVKLYDYLSKLLRPITDMSIREFLDEVFGGEERGIRNRIMPRVRMRLRGMLKPTQEKKEESKTAT